MEIAISRKKLVKSFLISIVFIALGIWMLVYKPEVSNSIFNQPALKYGTGVLSIVFFGLLAILLIIKYLDKKPGLIIDERGITDNSSSVQMGFIPWSDITGFSTAKMMGQEFLIVLVRNPAHYIERSKTALRRNSMGFNLRNYGSPLVLSAQALSCSFSELKEMAEEAWQTHAMPTGPV